MKTIKRKALSFVLCLLMVVSVVPATAVQTFAGEDVPEKKVTVTSVTYTNDPLGPCALIKFQAAHIYSGCPIAYIDPMIGCSYGGYEYDLDTQVAANLPTGWSLTQDSETSEWQLLCSPLNLTGGKGAPPEGEEIWVGVDVTSSDGVNDSDQLKLTVPKTGESVTVQKESTVNTATITNVFIKADGSPAPIPPFAKSEWVTFWDKDQTTTVIEAPNVPGFSVSPASYTLHNGDTVTFTYTQKPLEDPQNVSVKVVSMEEGTMKLEGGSAEITGTVATLEVSFDKAETPDEYWVATLKKNPESSSGFDKMGSGNMPFVKNTTTPASFEDGEGPNGETVTEKPNDSGGTTITVVKKVVKRDETTGSEFLDREAYKTGDDILVRVMSERGQYENYEHSKEIDIEIPFDEKSIGKEFTPAGENSALVLNYFFDAEGHMTDVPQGMERNYTVTWPKEQETFEVVPVQCAGYTCTPAKHTVKNDDVVSFEYRSAEGNSALVLLYFFDTEGHMMDVPQGIAERFTVYWPKEQETFDVFPTSYAGFNCTPDKYTVKDDDVVKFEYHQTAAPKNLSDSAVSYPEGMDQDSEFTESDLAALGLKWSFSGNPLKENVEYTKEITTRIDTETEKSVWDIKFVSVEPFTTGDPIEVTLKKSEKEEITSVTLDQKSFVYNGEIQHANVKEVKAGDKVLSASDYTVKYSSKNSKWAGIYTITVTGTGNYTGSKNATYKIEQAQITDATLSEVLYVYNRQIQKPVITSVKSNNMTLTTNDYDAEYSNPNSRNKGEYTVSVTGRGNYTGAIDVIYHIDPAVVASVTLDEEEFTYNQKAQKSKVKEVKSENGLVLASDEYTVTYAAPKSTDAGSYEITVAGKGNFTGSVDKTYKIEEAEITKVTLNKYDFTYNGTVQKASIKSVKAGDLVLTKDDYDAVWSNPKSTDANGYTIDVTGKGNYKGRGYAGYRINPVKISKVTVDKIKYTYNKKAQRPLVTKVKAGDLTLKKTDYSVTYSKNASKDVGGYTITVQSKNPNYDGKVTKTYIINPIGTSITKLKASSKSATVTWKKQKTKMSKTTITGYQIQASLKKSFKSIASKATVKGASKTSGQLTKLKAGKKYYVRIRTYKTIGKNTYFSDWKVYKKTVKVKK